MSKPKKRLYRIIREDVNGSLESRLGEFKDGHSLIISTKLFDKCKTLLFIRVDDGVTSGPTTG